MTPLEIFKDQGACKSERISTKLMGEYSRVTIFFYF